MNEHAKLDLTPPKAPKAPIAPGAAAAPKAPKEPKEPKAPKEPRISRFKTLYPDSAKVSFTSPTNPKRGAAGERYAAYMNTTNVGDFIKAGGTYSDIAWNIGHGLMTVTV